MLRKRTSRKIPVIGITGHFEKSNNKYYVDQQYIDAVAASGGVPVILPLFRNAGRFLDIIDGLLVTGGGITPLSKAQLKKKMLPSLEEQNEKRYGFEKFLLIEARHRKLPILGICRGHQMIAEVFGGSVSDDNPERKKNRINHNQKAPDNRPTHSIRIIEGSILKDILAVKTIEVNSFHRQRILTLPKEFMIDAIADDGTIESISSKDGKILGVQFHPEKLMDAHPVFRRIFDKFIMSCI